MKKKLVGIICGALMASMAVPALADHALGGYFRTEGVITSGRITKDAPDNQFVAQRLRAKWTNTLNDYITIVWFGEVDGRWGTDTGFAQGTDGINIQTKHLYAAIKMPGATDVTFVVGLQTIKDSIQSTFIHDDAAALTAKAKFDMVSLAAGWSKLAEGSLNNNDDTDLYMVIANVKPNDTMSFGADIFWVHAQDENSNPFDLYVLDVNGMVKVADISLSGFFAYQTGTLNRDDVGGTETDIAAMAAFLQAAAKFSNVNASLSVLWFGADEDDEDLQSWTHGGGGYEYYKLNMPIMLTMASKTTGGFGDRVALTNFAYQGFGLLGIVANVKADFAPFYVKGGLGYFMAMSEERNDSGTDELEGTDIGTEISASVGMKVAEAADLSVNGSYAILGSAFDNMAGGEDPDDMYTATILLNIPY